MRNGFYMLAIVLVLSLNACSDSTPLNKLKNEKITTDLTPEFWANESSMNTSLWRDAVQFCLKQSKKPNCGYVIQIVAFNNSSKTAPAIGHSGHAITIPDFNYKPTEK